MSTRTCGALLLTVCITPTLGSPIQAQCQAWSNELTVNGQPDDDVLALTSWDPDGSGPLPAQLVAGGRFRHIGGVLMDHIALWDGSSWQPLGSGMNDDVDALTTWDPDGAGPEPRNLVAGGRFTTSGGLTTNHIAHWNGTAWQIFGNGLPSGDVAALTTWDPDGAMGPLLPEVVAGGALTTPFGVARWDGSMWQGFGAGVGGVRALATWDPINPLLARRLVAAGSFFSSGGTTLNFIAVWSASDGWQPFGAGLDLTGTSLAIWDHDNNPGTVSRVVVGGYFENADGSPVNHIAQWTGSTWQSIGSGFDDAVQSLVLADPDGAGPLPTQLVAGGQFTTAGGPALNRIAHWDGSNWQPFGPGVSFSSSPFVWAVTTWDADGSGPLPAQLVVAGKFSAAGGLTARNIAIWKTEAPTITQPPASAFACPGGPAPFSVVANGSSLSYRWQIETAPNVWTTLGNDPLPLPCGGSAHAAPFDAPTTQIGVTPCPGVHDYSIRAVVTNPCGSANSAAVTLHIRLGPPADLNCDDIVNNFDIDPFVLALTNPSAYAASFPNCDPANADINCDAAINNFDIDPFVNCLVHQGCL